MRQLLLFVAVLIAQGCSMDDDAPINDCTLVPVEEQDEIIDQYIDENGWTMQTTASGLRYAIETPGTGDNISYGDTIEFSYQGVLLDGTTFDSGTIGPLIVNQGAFIPGFEEGLLLFNEGTEGLLIIPAELAYGCFPPAGSIIGENEILVFEMTIITVDS